MPPKTTTATKDKKGTTKKVAAEVTEVKTTPAKTTKKKSSTGLSLKEVELNILNTAEQLKKDIQATLIEQRFVPEGSFEIIEKINKKIDTFSYDADDIRSNIKLLEEFTQYAVDLKRIYVNKNLLKAVFRMANSNTWLRLKGEWYATSDGGMVLKTDAFVNKEVDTRMENFIFIESFIEDFEREVKQLETSVNQILILLNVKIKTEREETKVIEGFKSEADL